MDGAINGMKGPRLPIVSGVTVMKDSNGEDILVIVHQTLYNGADGQQENLLLPTQCRLNGIIVDEMSSISNTASGSMGCQCISLDTATIPLIFDGANTFFLIRKLTTQEFSSLPCIVITPEEEFEPETVIRCHRNKVNPPTWVKWYGPLA